MTHVTKHIPAHRLAMIEAFQLAMEGKPFAAKVKVKEARTLTNKFYQNK